METRSRSNLGWALTFLCVVAPLVLFGVPAEHMYGGETLCLYTRLWGRSCWGCGITRALYAVLHLDFAEAWSYNKMVVVIAPITIYLWAREAWSVISWIKKVGERRI